MSQRRVLHVLEATRGGTRTHVLDLLPALAARGWKCGLVYSSQRNPDFPNDAQHLEARGVATWDVPMARGPHPGEDARAAAQVARIARAFGPGIVHAHSSKAGLVARVAAPLVRALLVYTPHCVAFDTLLPLAQRKAALWAEIALAGLVARYIAVSQTEMLALRRSLPIGPTRVTLIRNGLDLSRFPAAPARISSGPFTIGCFGRLSAQKNQSLLLHALKQMLQAGEDARLLLVGGGEDEPELRRLAAWLEIESFIEWAGEVADALPLYARCDALALPSRWEGCPYSLLEGMAARLPVVAADLFALREILADDPGRDEDGASASPAAASTCGVLCRAHPREFARALARLKHDAPRRVALGDAARARIESRFTLERMADETVQVYDALGR